MDDLIRLTTYCPNEYTADLVARVCEGLGCSRTVVGVEEEPEAVARVRQEMTCPACSASMRGPVQVQVGTGLWFGGNRYALAHRWTCPCGCVVVMPVGEGRT
jgi:hypothetical protein